MLIFGKAKENLSHARESSFSLEVRFLLTFVMLLITITLAVAIIFAAFGIFDINRSQTALLLEHELVTISENVETEYSIIASHAINLSKSLTLELEHCLDDLGITPSEIRDYPELLDKLMRSVYPTLSAELRALKSSGTFIILDATVNPSLENADSSRAGIFLKNISAQNNAFSTHYDLRYLYGPFDIGRDHGLSFLPQ